MSADGGFPLSPRPVIRGESLPVNPSALPASIDYLNFTATVTPNAAIDFALSVLGARSAVERKGGLHGYDHSVDVEGFCMIAYGGDSQRGTVLVSFNGEGCARIRSWLIVHSFIQQHGGKITRCDVCADDVAGKFLTVRKAINAFKRREFVSGGRPPKAELIDDLGSGAGKTLYVGSRAGGKLARIYEKGKQLGDIASPWVRGEVEFHSKDRVIPLDILLDPVRFLAGAFPYFSAFCYFVEKIRTVKNLADATVAAVTRWLRDAGGTALNVVLRSNGGDVAAAIASVVRPGVPRRLQWCRESFV